MDLLKVLGTLLSGMSPTEAASLIGLIATSIIVAVKSAFRFNEYIQKGRAASQAATPAVNGGNESAHQQILIQLQLTKDKLVAIESKVDDQKFSMPKELATELNHMFKKLEEIHSEHVGAHKDIGKTVNDSLDTVAIMKEKITNIELALPHLKNELKEAIREVNHRVESTADKMAILQGTVVGNMSSRSGR